MDLLDARNGFRPLQFRAALGFLHEASNRIAAACGSTAGSGMGRTLCYCAFFRSKFGWLLGEFARAAARVPARAFPQYGLSMNRGDRESAVREDNSKNAELRAEQELITAKEPFVSIGMPVYNGENFLRQALSSLLAQDYPRFDLIISDNASDDGTEEICREYQARDSRT